MTFSEYRRYGFVSRLAEIECKGPSKDIIGTQKSIRDQQIGVSQQQSGVGQQQYGFSGEDRNRAFSLIQPYISQQTALASGDRNAAVAAAMPAISQISAGYQGAKDSVFNNLRPGAARDAALANLETQRYTSQGGTLASLAQQAPGNLANVGSQMNQYSLQELGAALSGYSGASNSLTGASYGNLGAGKLQADASSAKWGPLVGLAGIAGRAATSIFSGGQGKDTGQVDATYGSQFPSQVQLPVPSFPVNPVVVPPPPLTPPPLTPKPNV